MKPLSYRFTEFIQKNLLYNSAILIDDNGDEIGRARKSFLWHLTISGFNLTPIILFLIPKLAELVCLFVRMDALEIARSFLWGRNFIDLTNLVTTVEREKWTNPQVDYIIPRALENRVWIVLANKVGEENSIHAVGKVLFSPEEKQY